MVPNGILLEDETINAQTGQFIDYVLDHQDETGWLGPEVRVTLPFIRKPSHPRSGQYDETALFLGAVRLLPYYIVDHPSKPYSYPFFFGAIQMAEADPSRTDRIVTALHKWVKLANTMIHNNGEGVEEWGASRWADLVMVLQWCFLFPGDGEGYNV